MADLAQLEQTNFESPPLFSKNEIYAAFAGGVGSFGANLSIFRHGDTTVYIDAGSGFGNNLTPGVNRTLPGQKLIEVMPADFLIFTHAHEDHIGALPFIYDKLKDSIALYASAFTISMIKFKLADNGLDAGKFDFKIVNGNETYDLGDFIVEMFFMPHSIPQAFSVGLIAKQNRRKLYFTSDFKTKGIEEKYSPQKIKDFSSVDFLFCDSTGSLDAAYAQPESVAVEGLRKIITQTEGRIFITTFSSHIERIRSLFQIALENKRQVGVLGFSMKATLKSAFAVNEFDLAPEQLREPSRDNTNSLWIVAGCQSEVGSSFYRLTNNELGGLRLTEKDTIIYSSSKIPGNEENIYRCLNNAASLGVKIYGIDKHDVPVHASGHGKIEDINDVVELIDPACIVPVHGDALHFQAMSKIFTQRKRRVVEIKPNLIYRLDKIPEEICEYARGDIFMEPGETHSDYDLYKTRLSMASHGLCNVVINKSTKKMVSCEYIGVASKKYLKENLTSLQDSICKVIDGEFDREHFKEKRVKEKIYKFNKKNIRKEPFVNLIIVGKA